jgi:hypothetical protein
MPTANKPHANKPAPSPSARKASSKKTATSETVGNGGETHQRGGPALTTNHGVPLSDNQNSLRAGERGPTLLEDFILREKIFHFDHERIPERIVHARGSGAHGYFECTHPSPTSPRPRLLPAEGRQLPGVRALLHGGRRRRVPWTPRATCVASR